MDSINQNQPEQNREDLTGAAAIARIQKMAKAAQTCVFRTNVALGESGGVRPMSVQQVDDAGHLWFLSASDSHKNQELAANPAASLYFQESAHSGFLQLDGTASISTDPSKIKELWEPILKTWFTGGVDDPRVTVIHFVPTEGYYWDNKHGDLVAGAKMVLGAALGKTLDDSIEGTLRL